MNAEWTFQCCETDGLLSVHLQAQLLNSRIARVQEFLTAQCEIARLLSQKYQPASQPTSQPTEQTNKKIVYPHPEKQKSAGKILKGEERKA